MKRIFTTVLACATALFTANAQLQDGSVAPNFTGTDLNGNSHTLYEYLGQGYSVVLDFSAAWCGPCWNYHNSGALEDLYINHGPTGLSGVSNSTTNDVMVFFIEGEAQNTGAQLTGTSGSGVLTSQGNWVQGTPYPIIDNASFNNAYQIGYFPTIYLVCPNRRIVEIGKAPAATIYSAASNCPVATFANDPAIFSYTGGTISCSNIPLTAKLQNMGTAPLTAATVKAYFNDVEVASYDWTGNLPKYGIADITVGSFTPSSLDTIEIKVTSANSDVANDAAKTPGGAAPEAVSQFITVKITTDAYGSETTWKLKNGNQIIAQGGPYNDLQAAGETVQPPVTYPMGATGCFTFEISDSEQYQDGMCCDYGNGGYQVVDANGNVLASGGDFGLTESKQFKVSVLGVEDETAVGAFNVFPNPSEGNFNLDLSLLKKATVAVNVTNVMGQMVYNDSKQNMAAGQHIMNMNLSSLSNGMYMVNVYVGDKLYSKRITIAK
ncbi:MAG: T9SS type A sorting domain-containing protein [Sphingobacteriales bacterium JAD_PAG50586_3]|nr:MAG: T9SS type A sorting domain-containing protein [Sphingobacteriales bacterium JAD_PAG50586_3]